ncbi:MAG TPA: hypothetical protein VIO94_00265 [Phenylobacterium sp.]
MNLHDQNLRLLDLEVAISALARALAAEGQSPVLELAIRTARQTGGKGAVDLLRGERSNAAYRRA